MLKYLVMKSQGVCSLLQMEKETETEINGVGEMEGSGRET